MLRCLQSLDFMLAVLVGLLSMGVRFREFGCSEDTGKSFLCTCFGAYGSHMGDLIASKM